MPAVIARLLAGTVGLLETAGFATAHRIVTYTPNMAEELGLDPDSERVFPHGARYVDTERFSVQVPFAEREDVVGFVGRLDKEKGIRELADVAKRLPEGVTFRFVGDGPLYDWLATELADEIESGTVELAGWIDHEDVPTELNRMKLLVMPSHPTEGLPTTILESLACGTPVYATPVSGVPNVVKEGETGFLIHSREPGTVVRDLEEILSNSEDLGAISSCGRALIEEEYSFKAAQSRYRELLSQVE
jgi:glycosyltransferase involved in cell wall biosynthesis